MFGRPAATAAKSRRFCITRSKESRPRMRRYVARVAGPAHGRRRAPTRQAWKAALRNSSTPAASANASASYWAARPKRGRGPRVSLFGQPVGWGFHVYARGVHMLDEGLADEVEFWNF